VTKLLLLCLSAIMPIAVGAAEFDEPAEYGIGPWRLGMTRDDVRSFEQFGPYQQVQVTGGLETWNAKVEGKTTNVSFFFDDEKLSYIHVWKYEGSDFEAAKQSAVELFDLFAAKFGGAHIKDVNDAKPLDRKAFIAVVTVALGRSPETFAKLESEQKVASTLNLDVIPERQPASSRLHGKLIYSSRHKIFFVFLFQDVVGAPSRDAEATIQVETL
jgi:hypothetical protein